MKKMTMGLLLVFLGNSLTNPSEVPNKARMALIKVMNPALFVRIQQQSAALAVPTKAVKKKKKPKAPNNTPENKGNL